jgi:formylglycine-generating enzyme required for sulfatase activity
MRAHLALLPVVALFAACEGVVGAPPDGGAEDLAAVADLAPPEDLAPANGCPGEMARLAGPDAGFCVDRWEAHVVELDGQGHEQPHSPFVTVDGLTLRAKSAPGVYPQGYISQVQASAACKNAGKRLCSAAEFALACRGPDGAANYYPYGGTKKAAGACNEGKGSSVARFFGSNPNNWTYANFNDPRLNQWDGGLAPTGAYPRCVSPDGVYDCVGNLHEWGNDPADSRGRGRFRGGFYGDAEINGPGCRYVTSAHELAYHDYSTGFRCCADAR